MVTQLFQVDAFTEEPFSGNPAGVCLLDEPRPEKWMQAVAVEMNLSETAFLLREGDGYRLRWFTPAVEVDLCGHATLASAHVLWQTGAAAAEAELRFYTRSGMLTARKQGDWIELNFPIKRVEGAPAPAGMIEALHVMPTFIGKSQFDYLVEVASEEEVREASPDMAALLQVETRGVVLTARGNQSGFDFISRFFAPRVGVPEDPVTGSAHCALTPYWAEKLGKTRMNAYQASRRGGRLNVRLEGERVVLAGKAVTVFEAKLDA